MTKTPFNQRFRLTKSKPISNDFPKTAQIALAYLIESLASREYQNFRFKQKVTTELLRSGRQHNADENQFESFLDFILFLLGDMKWEQIYIFCERVYDTLLAPSGTHIYYGNPDDPEIEWREDESLAEIQEYFTNEVNTILLEENLTYHLVNGQFQRRGRAQTQKSLQRVGTVLSNPALANVLTHYNKAREFFDEFPEPDAKNCIKEALCALEACLEILSKKPASKDFTKVVKQLEGNDDGQIPQPIAQGMIKLHAYRGSGQGVAHAALQGSKVSEVEAELVLSLVASYITYLVDLLLLPEEDIPF
jgi:hypothetical protein